VEESSKEEIAQKATNNLEKAANLEYFGQVFSPDPSYLGVATSSSTAPQQPAQATTQRATTDKGKEIQQEQPLPSAEQQEEMAEAPANTEQQTQEQVLPRQEVTVETSVLQTPTNEERTRKRDREEETPLTTSTNQ